jgi:hypothetical protein
VVPIHFGPDMLPDWSMRKTMSSWMRWASALVEVQTPASSTPPPPPSKWTLTPPVPPVPLLPEVLLEELVVPVVVSVGALQPHHAAATQVRVSDTKTR